MTYLEGYNLWIIGEGDEKNYDLIVQKYDLKEKVFFFINGQIIFQNL